MWIFGQRMDFLTHGLDHWHRLEGHTPEALAAPVAHDLTAIVLPRLAAATTASDALALAEYRAPIRL